MDSTSASREEKAPPPDDDGASSESSSAKVVQQGPEPLHDVNRGAAVTTKVVESGGEDEDEQVERFFALLANIRALRNVYGAAISCSGSAECRGRKRAREAEESSPWRPAFRMEDFLPAHEDEEVAAAGKKETKIMEERTEGRTSMSAVADGDEEDDGAVVEETPARVTACAELNIDREASSS
jgi:hypothetical protein